MRGLLLTILLLLSYVGMCQVRLTGRIEDDQGVPISECHIGSLTDKATAVTNTDGTFEFTCELPCQLEVRHLNFENRIISVSKNQFLVVKMQTKIQEMETVEVEADRAVTESISNLAAINQISGLFGEHDITKYMVTLPGVSVINSFDAGFSVRGGATTENMFLIEGIKIADPKHISSLVTTYDPYVLGSSTIYKSGFPVQYGGYLSSYIDMNIRSSNDEKNYQGEATLGMVSSSFKSAVSIGSENNHDIKISGRVSYLDVVSEFYLLDESTAVPKYSLYDLTASYTGKLNDNWTFKGFGMQSEDELPLEIANGEIHNMNWKAKSAGAHLSGVLSTRSAIELSIGYNSSQSKYELSGSNNASEVSSNLENMNVNMAYDLRIGENWYWNIGTKFENNQYEVLDKEQVNSANQIYYFHSSIDYIKSNLRVNAGINAGVLNTLGSEIDWAPRLKVDYRMDNLEFVADYARTYQYEEFIPFFTVRTPIDIALPLSQQNHPAQSDHLSAGVAYQDFYGVSLYIGAFHKSLNYVKDFTDESRLNLNQIEMIEGEGTAHGAEVELEYNSRIVSFRSNYTWTDSKRQFDAINDGQQFSPPYDIRHNVSISGSIKILKSLRFLALWTYSSGVYITIPEGVTVAKDIVDPNSLVNYLPIFNARYNYQLSARHRLDLTLEYHKNLKRDAMKIAMGTYNTYNRKNPDFIYLDVEQVDDFFVSFVPKAKIVLPFVPYVSFTYYINNHGQQ
ncbi:MAG: TonB-dependent receptor [Reichenbachiella sp.]